MISVQYSKFVLIRGCDPVRAAFAKKNWEPLLQVKSRVLRYTYTCNQTSISIINELHFTSIQFTHIRYLYHFAHLRRMPYQSKSKLIFSLSIFLSLRHHSGRDSHRNIRRRINEVPYFRK